jgi:type III pantothenate kinase
VILLVDAGNSRIKWRLRQRGEYLSAGELATASCHELFKSWSGIRAQAACISSVAGDMANQAIRDGLAQVLEGAGDRQHWLASTAQAYGISSHYKPAESLGVDRFVALVAARRRQAIDWVVVNVGTAMTVDMLTADGQFLGGGIVPGPALMRDALEQGTAGVHVSVLTAGIALPNDTPSAVGQGIAWALWGVVEGMTRQLSQAVGRKPCIVLSGGARGFLRPFLMSEVIEVDELVLEGLACIARDLGYDA